MPIYSSEIPETSTIQPSSLSSPASNNSPAGSAPGQGLEQAVQAMSQPLTTKNRPGTSVLNRLKALRHTSLSQALRTVATPICQQHGFAHVQIIADWGKMVGDKIAEISTPISLTFPLHETTGGVLICGLANPSYVLHLQMQAPLLMQRVNLYFGYNAVETVRFRFSPSAFRKRGQVIPYRDKEVVTTAQAAVILQGIATAPDPEIQLLLQDLFAALFAVSEGCAAVPAVVPSQASPSQV